MSSSQIDEAIVAGLLRVKGLIETNCQSDLSLAELFLAFTDGRPLLADRQTGNCGQCTYRFERNCKRGNKGSRCPNASSGNSDYCSQHQSFLSKRKGALSTLSPEVYPPAPLRRVVIPLPTSGAPIHRRRRGQEGAI